MSLNIEEWVRDLQKKGNLKNEELSAFMQVMNNPQVKQEVLDAFERQSDYSRKMDELRQKMTQEDAYAQQLAEWEAEAKKQLTESQAEVQKYQKSYYELASKYSVPPEELYKSHTTTTSAATQGDTTVTKTPTGEWITKQDADNAAAIMFRLNAKLIALNQEHIKLFGKPMENIDTFTEEALKSGARLEDTFRTFYKIADREKELAEADVQARIQKAIDEERTKWATQGGNPLGVPGNVPKGWQSPVLENVKNESVDLADRAASRARVSEVLAAFNAENAKNGLPTF